MPRLSFSHQRFFLAVDAGNAHCVLAIVWSLSDVRQSRWYENWNASVDRMATSTWKRHLNLKTHLLRLKTLQKRHCLNWFKLGRGQIYCHVVTSYQAQITKLTLQVIEKTKMRATDTWQKLKNILFSVVHTINDSHWSLLLFLLTANGKITEKPSSGKITWTSISHRCRSSSKAAACVM